MSISSFLSFFITQGESIWRTSLFLPHWLRTNALPGSNRVMLFCSHEPWGKAGLMSLYGRAFLLKAKQKKRTVKSVYHKVNLGSQSTSILKSLAYFRGGKNWCVCACACTYVYMKLYSGRLTWIDDIYFKTPENIYRRHRAGKSLTVEKNT